MTRPLVRVAGVVVAALLGVALALPAGALAHGGPRSTSKRFLSVVTGIVPPVPGLDVSVADRDDRLVITNNTGKTVIVKGYENEPYLRFDARGVSVNRHSPSRWLDLDRFRKEDYVLPKEANPLLPPAWLVVSAQQTWEWHDHRIQYMGIGTPDEVLKPTNGKILVVNWEVGILVDGQFSIIHGRLDYFTGGRGPGAGLILAIALPVGGVLAALGGWLLLRRRRLARAPA